MSVRLLLTDFVFEGPFPRLARRLRIGIVGGGRIAVTQAMAAQLSTHWEVVEGALSSDPQLAMAVAARRDGIAPPADWLNLPTVEHGARGVRFIEAAVESHSVGGAWVACRAKL